MDARKIQSLAQDFNMKGADEMELAEAAEARGDTLAALVAAAKANAWQQAANAVIDLAIREIAA